jgi:hypothetical protein
MSRVTAEVRWFWPGPIPRDLQDWFKSSSHWLGPVSSETRVDEYLRHGSQKDLGIKRRNGLVEIKGLVANERHAVAFVNCESVITLWSKWSTRSLDLSRSALIPIRKHRLLRRFIRGHAGIVETAAGNPRPANGCDFEITALEGPESSRWWTLGFESSGPLGEVELNLVATVVLVGDYDPPKIESGIAQSYPGWLADRSW